MAFPTIVFGEPGDQRATSSTKIKNYSLGTRMHLPDGSVFAYARVSSTAATVAGDLYVGGGGYGASDAGWDNDAVITAGGGAGSTTVTVTAGATTAVTANQFEDGWFGVQDQTGEGHVYQIDGNTSAAAGSAVVITVKEGFHVGLAAGTSQAAIKENEYAAITHNTADTVNSGPVVGIMPTAATASYYCWVQRRGTCMAATDNTTLVQGNAFVASTSVAGQVAPLIAGSTVSKARSFLGYVMCVAASSEYSMVSLQLD